MATETTTFEIKTHKHEYTELYVYLKREIEAKKGVAEEFRSYVDEAALKGLQEYRETANTFYPDNHWYAFSDGELVGYAHIWPQYDADGNAAKEAATDIPGVKDDNQEVFEALSNAVIERAKELGVKTLTYGIDEKNEVAIKDAKNFGFTKGDITQATSTTNINDLKFEKYDHVEIFDFDEEKHLEDQIAAYDKIGITRDFITAQNERLRGMGDRAMAWKVAYEDGKLTGHSLVLRYSDDGDTAQLLTVTKGADATDDQYVRATKTLYAAQIEKIQGSGVDKLQVIIPQSRLNQKPAYEEYGFKFRNIYQFTKSV